jgi:hypothetical protein
MSACPVRVHLLRFRLNSANLIGQISLPRVLEHYSSRRLEVRSQKSEVGSRTIAALLISNATTRQRHNATLIFRPFIDFFCAFQVPGFPLRHPRAVPSLTILVPSLCHIISSVPCLPLTPRPPFPPFLYRPHLPSFLVFPLPLVHASQPVRDTCMRATLSFLALKPNTERMPCTPL